MAFLRHLMMCLLAAALPGLCGCVSVPVSASNPVPHLTTVAVVPFFNLSAERSVDGRRFAIAYYGELQKTPGFQVVPVGVVEQAIIENQFSMEHPGDVLRLAEVLGADAVVVGAVTEYNPYYPPKLALQVQWYSPRRWQFSPGIQHCPPPALSHQDRGPLIARAQSGDSPFPLPDPRPVPVEELPGPRRSPDNQPLDEPAAAFSPAPHATGDPLMTYTRYFDGADPRLTGSLRKYLAWRSDRRSGDWEAHLQRSDDFIQFCSHLMVMEMLSLHGAPVASEYVPFWKTY